MGMTSMPGIQPGGMGGKSMGGPNTTGPGGYGMNYDGNPNQGGMPTQFTSAGPGMGVGMDYRNLGGVPGVMGGPDPLPSTGMGGGKSGGPVGGIIPPRRPVGGMLPGIIGGQMPGMGGQLVGGGFDKPIFGGGTQPIGTQPLAQTTPDFNTYNTETQLAPTVVAPPTPIFGGNQQQPITQGTGQLPPGFGALSPVDRSQIGNAQIGMTNRFAPPNAPGVRRARVAKPITRTRSR